MALRLLTFLLLVLNHCANAQEQKRHTVYFELDQFNITIEQKQLLEAWVQSVNDTVSKIEITSHADYLGTSNYNATLSKNRANAVLALIEEMNSFAYRTSIVSAEGEKFSKKIDNEYGNPNDRKVEVTLSFAKTKPSATQQNRIPFDSNKSMESDLLLAAKVGQNVVLSNLNFFPGRHYLIPSAMSELERLITIMNEKPSMKIEIQGHICCKLDSIDGYDINTKTYSLSANRANYIKQQLVLAGVEASRVKHRGFAGSRPLINPELTEKDRQRNRRVEIKILEK